MSRAREISNLLAEPEAEPRQLPSGQLPAGARAEGPPGPLTPRDVVQTLVARERARRHLVDFARFMDPDYRAYPVHRYIAGALEDVEAGRCRRLAIFVPPATGKSRLCSEMFPAWLLGRHPKWEFIEASYDYDLAAAFGRNVRNLLKDARFQLVFPGVELASDSTAMDEWKTSQEGEYKAEGVGGGLIGFHAHVAVIDDPFKGYAAAASQKNRDQVWDWYTGVLLNRLRSYLDGPGAVVLIMQRWHDDDLGGRIEKLNELGEERWRVISLPSLAEPGDPLGRRPGEALLPEGPNQRPVEELLAIQARHPAMFMAVHQQKPVADEGDMFRRGWLQLYGPQELPKRLTKYVTTDYAMTEGSGDYTVLYVAGVCPQGRVWLLDRRRLQCDMLQGVESTVDLVQKWGVGKVFLERTMMTKAYGPLLRKAMRDRGVWAVMEDVSVIGRGQKDSPDRAGILAGAMQMGYIRAPMGAPWLGELEYELLRFPNGRYDDQVDALVLLALKLNDLRRLGTERERPTGPTVVAPVGLTFGQARDQVRRGRLGLPVRGMGIVLPGPGKSVLDGDLDPEELGLVTNSVTLC